VNSREESVFIGWINLTESERREVNKEIQKYFDMPEFERIALRQRIMEQKGVILGPTSTNVCPCCGK
jgi:hypothetical protein